MTYLAYIILLQGTPVEGFHFQYHLYRGGPKEHQTHNYYHQIGMIQCFDKAMVLIARREN